MTYLQVNVEDIQIYPVCIPLKAPVKMAGVTVQSADNIIICVQGDNGIVGWGEAS